MIYLLIDIGNSRIKWGLFKLGDLQPVLTDVFEYAARESVEIQSLMHEHFAALPTPDRSMLASVGAPVITRQVEEWLTTRWRSPERLQSMATACGVSNAYSSPGVLGVDRWAGLIAAHALWSRTVLIANCGTALTLDLLHASGQHYGGFIIPGLNLMYRALHKETHQLPLVTDEASGVEFADNTAQAIAGGCQLALAGAVEKALRAAEMQFNESVICVITGGHGMALQSQIDAAVLYEPHLVLKGMAVVLNQAEMQSESAE